MAPYVCEKKWQAEVGSEWRPTIPPRPPTPTVRLTSPPLDTCFKLASSWRTLGRPISARRAERVKMLHSPWTSFSLRRAFISPCYWCSDGSSEEELRCLERGSSLLENTAIREIRMCRTFFPPALLLWVHTCSNQFVYKCSCSAAKLSFTQTMQHWTKDRTSPQLYQILRKTWTWLTVMTKTGASTFTDLWIIFRTLWKKP